MSNSEKNIPKTSDASEEAAALAAETCPVRAAYDAAAQALSEALARKRALTERAATMTRAREAAQAEADAARQQWRGMLRDAEGTLTRDIQKLRAAEASALTLVEEYGVMHQEIGMQVTGMEVSVAELAEVAIGKREAVIELASREAFDAMVESVVNEVARAFMLYKRAASVTCGGRMASDSEVRAAFLDQLGRQVDKRVKELAGKLAQTDDIPRPELNGVDTMLMVSSLRREKLRQEIGMACLAK
ncbi:hypothetical protein NDK37_20105 [Xanthomonas citri pv. glycines]|uniref:Uncharacterized protein n=1 Tax=Xanthomonas campestris pv. glycines TaxID=473421 RepID=A0AAX0HXI1_XANCG|nr:hypothetical protein [Xanthomonas citri]OEY89226.1 hypothetical protein BIY41_19290 [Xanthomonas citri pv. glycines]OOX04567.1 hypothetical protein Xgly_09285 [Xanthomonas citri pv. glycines]QEQ75119.1 hypothetical protein C2859_20810 [Xanthomonas citri pv. glycines]QTK34183.1 hypothetical protein XcgCFBP2526_19650 [Xanthomonas citri pv. glycines CFBP 2526]UIX74533.1 hypothetical protein LMJ37_14400 [Xanthomonas citri pv. glycines]